jgi:hypothetical protein
LLKKHSIFIIVTVFVLTLFSCKKEPEQSCSSCSVGGTEEPIGFYYSKNGGTVIKADSAFFNVAFKTITSYYQGIATRVNIKTSSQAPGTYTFSIPANTLSYSEVSVTYLASGGSLIISENVNNKMSGEFVSHGSGGGITSITGRFKEIRGK